MTMSAGMPTTTPPAAAAPTVRERIRERTDGKIMRAVLDIIATQGIGALTMEAVARASGVAKTTLYRRYANADDLLGHISTMVGPPIDFTQIALSRATLRELLRRIQANFDQRFGLRAIGIVLSSSNPRVQELARQVIDPAQQRFCDYLHAGGGPDPVRADVDGPFVFQTVLGSMLACKAMGGDDEQWATRMATLLEPAIFA